MKVLFLTHRLPYAPNRGDRVRALHELRVMARHHEVHLASLVHDAHEASHVGDLQTVAASVTALPVPRLRNMACAAGFLPTRRPLTHVLLDSPQARMRFEHLLRRASPDIVLAYCSSMVRFAMEPPLKGLPFLLDMVDVDSGKWASLAEVSAPPRSWLYRREARCLRPFEAEAVMAAEATFAVNEREVESLRSLVGDRARLEILPNGVDVDHFRPQEPPSPSTDVIFSGVMDYPPNEEAALWLAGEVWPQVASARPGARLLLVGANPTRRLLDLPTRQGSIVVTGSVPDVRPYLWQAAVATAPLRVARGVQNKVLEAISAGLPVVATPVVIDGLPAGVSAACHRATTASEFATAVIAALDMSPEHRRATAARAQLLGLAWETRLQPLLRAIERHGGPVNRAPKNPLIAPSAGHGSA